MADWKKGLNISNSMRLFFKLVNFTVFFLFVFFTYYSFSCSPNLFYRPDPCRNCRLHADSIWRSVLRFRSLEQKAKEVFERPSLVYGNFVRTERITTNQITELSSIIARASLGLLGRLIVWGLWTTILYQCYLFSWFHKKNRAIDVGYLPCWMAYKL